MLFSSHYFTVCNTLKTGKANADQEMCSNLGMEDLGKVGISEGQYNFAGLSRFSSVLSTTILIYSLLSDSFITV